MKQHKLLYLLIFLSGVSYGQYGVAYLNGNRSYQVEKHLSLSDSNVHSSLKPYSLRHATESGFMDESLTPDFILDRMKAEMSEGDAGIFIIPLLEGGGTYEMASENQFLPNYGVGGALEGHIGEQFGFGGLYRYVGADLPSYLDSSIYVDAVVPGIGRALSPFTTTRVTDHWEAYASFSAKEFFDFQIGRGRHFWGDGYRSMFLSDNASPYPYARVSATFWNVQYMNLYSWHNDFTNGTNRAKFSSSHYLSWNISPSVNLGIFESVIWQGSDTLHNRGFDINYLNPVIFFRPQEFAQGSSDNSLLGMSLKVRGWDKYIFYGQLILDEFYLKEYQNNNDWWANKFGYQLGFKTYDLFNVDGLDVLTEFNLTRPYTWAHFTSMQNYGHNNQSLVHPVGSSFKESVTKVRFQKGKWTFDEQLNYLVYGEDSTGINYGSNMFQSYIDRPGDYGHTVAQGIQHNVLFNSISASYLISEAANLRVFGKYVIRLDRSEKGNYDSHLFQIGLSSNLWKTYQDF